MMTLTREGSRSIRQAALLFAVLTAAFMIWVTLGVGGEWLSNAVDDIGELVAALIAAGTCAAVSRRVDDGRQGWLFMAMSSLAWACGEAIWSYYDLVRGIEVPSPSAADLGFLAAVPLAVVGLRKLFPRTRQATRPRLGGVLGGVLMGSGALVVVWALTILEDAGSSELLAELVNVAYPVGDLFMAAVVLSAVRDGRGDRTTMHLVLAGILAFTVADTWFAVVVTIGDFGLPYWLDTGWVLGYLLIALGAMWAHHRYTHGAPRALEPVRWANVGGYRSDGRSATTALTTTRMTPSSNLAGRSWLATANTDHIVDGLAIALILTDASVVLYDLAAILRMLA